MRRGTILGGLGFAFPDDRAFDDREQTALRVVADLCAEALGRVCHEGLGLEILVVEDESGVRGLLEFALKHHGFAVRSATEGKEAAGLYGRHHTTIDVVLLDVQMPGLDGPETLVELRRVDPNVRFVFMSGNTGRYTAEQLRALGAACILPKPFSSMDEVVRILREAALSNSRRYTLQVDAER